MITEDGSTIEDTKARIAMARKKFTKKREILSGGMGYDLRKRLIKCLIWSVATYGAETWILSKDTIRRLESFEMWCWRKILKVRWIDRKTNNWLLKEAGEKRSLIHSIRKRKHEWLGHVLRHDGLLKVAIEGKLDGKRGPGRPRLGMISEMGNYAKLKEDAVDRERWRRIIKRTFIP